MISSWSNLSKLDSNELLEKGKNDFVDKRGIISNYCGMIHAMIGYVESIKGSIEAIIHQYKHKNSTIKENIW